MRDQDNKLVCIPIHAENVQVDYPSLKRLGSVDKPSSERVIAMDSAGVTRQPPSNRRAHSEDRSLSEEERRIIALIVAGYANKDIARQFSVGVGTIYRRTVRIMRKLRVANKFELVLFAIDHGIFNRQVKGTT